MKKAGKKKSKREIGKSRLIVNDDRFFIGGVEK